ncbi:MAG: transglycosylase SLT domain-containing protein [Rhodospirillales bacterium]|nr:transglycosylase SLT domain-containing protein [Rhodospirillales bacterium]
MAAFTNAIENISSASSGAPRTVLSAIRKASLTTGVDFDYMVGKAAQESGFDPNAKARTSSATGLYQFIEKTWLTMVRNHGEKYGLGDYASQIDAKGRVNDPALRREILALRKDPEASAMMAAEYAADNKRILEQTWGGEVGGTELYLAHFLGAGGAGALLKALDENPLQSGADILPRAANANRNVFYSTSTGRERSVAEIYNMFAEKFSGTQTFADGTRKAAQQNNLNINQTIAVEGWDRPDSSPSFWPFGETEPQNQANTTYRASDRRIPAGPQPLLAPSEILFLARLEESERGEPRSAPNSRPHERQSTYNE